MNHSDVLLDLALSNVRFYPSQTLHQLRVTQHPIPTISPPEIVPQLHSVIPLLEHPHIQQPSHLNRHQLIFILSSQPRTLSKQPRVLLQLLLQIRLSNIALRTVVEYHRNTYVIQCLPRILK